MCMGLQPSATLCNLSLATSCNLRSNRNMLLFSEEIARSCTYCSGNSQSNHRQKSCDLPMLVKMAEEINKHVTKKNKKATSENNFKWTSEAEDMLVENLEAYPCLYNTKHESYKNKDLRSKARDDLARLVGCEGE